MKKSQPPQAAERERESEELHAAISIKEAQHIE